MDNLVDNSSVALSLISLLVIPVAVLTILYLIKRNGFYISVNCWFCNSWTRVLYSDRNSFCCPFCLQYNGFNEDGGYNKVIKAQFDMSLNQYGNMNSMKTEPVSNGLCTYCNNNQQLKVRQLAEFVPLNEKNYDIEIEHFRLQLEKSYKLCKKCDKVLQRTIENQHAWIFGNRIKEIQKKGFNLLKSNKSRILKQTPGTIIFMNIIKFCLVVCLIFILIRAMSAKMNYPKSAFKVPEVFMPFTVVVDDWCHLFLNYTDTFIKNVSNKLHEHGLSASKDLRIMKNDILPITGLGLILEIILLIWHPKSMMWKVNELLGWIILIITSINTFPNNYFIYINALQIFCSFAIICGLLTINNGHQKLSRKKKYTFKKLKSPTLKGDSSDEEVFEETSNSSRSSTSQKSFTSNHLSASPCQLHSPKFVTQNVARNTANLNDSFITATSTKSSSIFNNSVKHASVRGSSNELHHSLDNLHLSNLNYKTRSCPSPVFSVNSVNRPIISPPKLKNITQNSWTAGGFWKSDITAYPVTADFASLSRSSSQSSGFMSINDQNPFSSLPVSREPSLYGDFEKAGSILSEPAYHFKPINSNNRVNVSFGSSQTSPNGTQLYYKAENNMFYPILKQNNMLLIHGKDIPRFSFDGGFSNLSVTGFQGGDNRYRSPVFGEKPVISSLFKNIQGLNTRSYTFKSPNC